MRTLIFIAIFLTVVSVKGKINPYIFAYQAHGFNDLDFFRQQLLKGIETYQIDISQATQSSCLNQSTWQPSLNSCFEGKDAYRLKICCLGLRGDTGSNPIFKTPFNTTYQLVSFISDPKNAFMFRQNTTNPQYQGKKVIAMNIQNGVVGSTLITDFLFYMFQAISNYNLNIDIFIGSERYVNYLDDRCFKKNLCNQNELYVANSPIIYQWGGLNEPYNLTSSEISGARVSTSTFGNDAFERRVQNFNAPVETLESACSKGFPKFMDLFDYPVIIWEPSHENLVHYTLEKWIDPQCKKTPQHSDVSSLAIATNQPPEMIELMSKQFNNTFVPEYGSKTIFNEVNNPHIDYLSDVDVFVVSYYDLVKQNSIIKFIDAKTNNNLAQISNTQKFQFVKAQQNGLFLAFADRLEVHNKISSSPIQYTLLYKEQINSTLLASDILISGTSISILKINRKSGGLNFEYVSTPQGQTLFSIDYELQNDIIPETNSFYDVSGDYDETTNQITGAFTFHVQTGDFKRIYMIIFQIDVATKSITVYQGNQNIDFGSQSRVKVTQISGQYTILEVHQDGTCQSGVLINNNEWSQCNMHQFLKDAQILNLKYVLAYSFGFLQDYIDSIKNGILINGCHQRIIQAKFYNGLNPVAVIRRDPISAFVRVHFVHQYVNYYDLPLLTTLFCGSTGLDQYQTGKAVSFAHFYTLEIQNLEQM